MAQPVTANRIGSCLEHGGLHLGRRVLFQLKSQPLLIPHGPQQPGGVVSKTFGVQGADKAASQVLQPAMTVQNDRTILRQLPGQRVDRKIPAGQVLVNGAGKNLGQASRPGIYFPAGGDQVNPRLVQNDRSGAKSGMGNDPATRLLGQPTGHFRGFSHNYKIQVF